MNISVNSLGGITGNIKLRLTQNQNSLNDPPTPSLASLADLGGRLMLGDAGPISLHFTHSWYLAIFHSTIHSPSGQGKELLKYKIYYIANKSDHMAVDYIILCVIGVSIKGQSTTVISQSNVSHRSSNMVCKIRPRIGKFWLFMNIPGPRIQAWRELEAREAGVASGQRRC